MLAFFNGCGIDDKKYEVVSFGKLEKAIQDTLRVIEDTYQKVDLICQDTLTVTENENEKFNLICINCKYKLTSKQIGPWIAYMLLTNIESGEQYKINASAPFPFIVYKNFLYIPEEYNLLVIGLSNNAKFRKYKLDQSTSDNILNQKSSKR